MVAETMSSNPVPESDFCQKIVFGKITIRKWRHTKIETVPALVQWYQDLVGPDFVRISVLSKISTYLSESRWITSWEFGVKTEANVANQIPENLSKEKSELWKGLSMGSTGAIQI